MHHKGHQYMCGVCDSTDIRDLTRAEQNFARDRVREWWEGRTDL